MTTILIIPKLLASLIALINKFTYTKVGSFPLCGLLLNSTGVFCGRAILYGSFVRLISSHTVTLTLSPVRWIELLSFLGSLFLYSLLSPTVLSTVLMLCATFRWHFMLPVSLPPGLTHSRVYGGCPFLASSENQTDKPDSRGAQSLREGLEWGGTWWMNPSKVEREKQMEERLHAATGPQPAEGREAPWSSGQMPGAVRQCPRRGEASLLPSQPHLRLT